MRVASLLLILLGTAHADEIRLRGTVNHHFALEMHTRFVYEGGERLTFEDDDLWVIINGHLVIDIAARVLAANATAAGRR